MNRGAEVSLPVQGVTKVVDTVGAGDCFHAGLLAWLKKAGYLSRQPLTLLDEKMLTEALQHAMGAAALNVQRQGCMPPSWLETRGWVEQMRPR
jgi:fructokinase